MKGLLPILFGSVLITPAVAQVPVPQADQDGNYSRTSYIQWAVVDPDLDGLSCRWSDAMPDDWYAPDAQFPAMNIRRWSVVQRFKQGTTLTANASPVGFVLLYDNRNLPWLKVSIGEGERICLVRANRRYVQPVN